MRFAHDFGSPLVLALTGLCLVLVIVYAGLLILEGQRRAKSLARFGEPTLVFGLESFDASTRRAAKSVLLVVALLCAFFALARPQYGAGTKLVPATNLDVVIVLDYSKSMYARDVVPSRIARAKAEVSQLVKELRGARFAAVAFAGEPIKFPLTNDGPAIAQFFRQMDPNDMPVGGTAIARALHSARELFGADAKAKEHVRVVVLITDGEDLEGDPVAAAEQLAKDGVRIDVVQIGGRLPEVIPDIAPDGTVAGTRKDEHGKPLTTALSAEGEADLAKIAEVGRGTIVRSERGTTGIETITKSLSKLMRSELSERVETVYAEVFHIPLGAALLLLALEAVVGEAPRRRRESRKAVPEKKSRLAKSLGTASLLLLLAVFGCGWDPARPFERESPVVNQAIAALDAGDAQAAASLLEDYLSTGPCKEGVIGGGAELLRRRPDGTFDLGLSLFSIGESYGRRFGEEEDGAGDQDAVAKGARRDHVDCALRIVRAIAGDDSVGIPLRARAHYLAGNLNFLIRQYADAVRDYDRALSMAPGFADAGDPIGADAAWNRAIALRREKEKDAGADAAQDAPPDAPDAAEDAARDSGQDANEAGPDGGKDGAANDAGDDAGRDAGQDTGSDDKNSDAGQDGGKKGDDDKDKGQPEAGAPDGATGKEPPPSRANQDERILDQLENAPTVQQQEGRNKAGKVRRGMVDK